MITVLIDRTDVIDAEGLVNRIFVDRGVLLAVCFVDKTFGGVL